MKVGNGVELLEPATLGWTPAFALRDVVPYPPACKPYGLEAGTEPGETESVSFKPIDKTLSLDGR